MENDGLYTDPHCVYIQNKDKLKAVQLEEDKAFWRFMGPLYLATTQQEKRPQTINQFLNNFIGLNSRSEIKFISYGLTTDDHGKIFKWAKEIFVLPKEILQNQDKANFLIKSITNTEKEGINLKNAILNMDETTAQHKRKALNTFINKILGQYWRDTEQEFRTNLI